TTSPERYPRARIDDDYGPDVLRDGERLRVPLALMDGVQREIANSQSLADARRLADDARSQYIANLNGWRNPKASLSDDEVFALAQRIAPMLGLAAPKRWA